MPKDSGPDGTLFESVKFSRSSNGGELTDAELEAWIESFPVEVPDGRIRTRRLPSVRTVPQGHESDSCLWYLPEMPPGDGRRAHATGGTREVGAASHG